MTSYVYHYNTDGVLGANQTPPVTPTNHATNQQANIGRNHASSLVVVKIFADLTAAQNFKA